MYSSPVARIFVTYHLENLQSTLFFVGLLAFLTATYKVLRRIYCNCRSTYSVKTAILILKDLFQPRTLYDFFFLTEIYELNDPHGEK